MQFLSRWMGIQVRRLGGYQAQGDPWRTPMPVRYLSLTWLEVQIYIFHKAYRDNALLVRMSVDEAIPTQGSPKHVFSAQKWFFKDGKFKASRLEVAIMTWRGAKWNRGLHVRWTKKQPSGITRMVGLTSELDSRRPRCLFSACALSASRCLQSRS